MLAQLKGTPINGSAQEPQTPARFISESRRYGVLEVRRQGGEVEIFQEQESAAFSGRSFPTLYLGPRGPVPTMLQCECVCREDPVLS